MKEKKQNIKTVISVIVFTILFAYFVNHTNVITGLIGKLISLTFPFLIGCGIAFVLNIPLSEIEKGLFKNENGKLYKAKRGISIIITYVLTFSAIALIIVFVAPEVGKTITKLQEKLPVVVENVKEWFSRYAEKYPEINKEIQNFNPDFSKLGSMLIDNGNTILSTTVSIFSTIIGTVVNILVGFVFSVYILSQKEKLGRQAKLISYGLFKESTADELLVFCKIAHTTFAKFFTCQFREGFILGSMFVVAMLIIGLPYAITIGIIIAITALIPVFGAFIGLFLGAFLILVDTPSKVLWFVILFFVLQNIENYLIYPKLVGGGIGLPPIWVLLAVLVGGDLMGVLGMFLFIPIVSVAYSYVKSIIYRRLKNKNIDVDRKEAPDDVLPLMEDRRRHFATRRKKYQDISDIPVVDNSGETDSTADSDIE